MNKFEQKIKCYYHPGIANEASELFVEGWYVHLMESSVSVDNQYIIVVVYRRDIILKDE